MLEVLGLIPMEASSLIRTEHFQPYSKSRTRKLWNPFAMLIKKTRIGIIFDTDVDRAAVVDGLEGI